MRSKGLLLAAMSMAIMGERLTNDNSGVESNSRKNEAEPPLADGCKRFYFNKNGECKKGEHLVYFDVAGGISPNEKFKYWLSMQE